MRENTKKPRNHRCRFRNCGKPLVRKRFGNNRLEDWTIFCNRKYCDRACMTREFQRRRG